eukprot:CAMPEP_0197525742 /NCGR_PEP_ID=MMETSP1318-20131121/14106_1 /TAXON_ID=552666 /ORGANISM="Partenskyella glossopodia, Strain RCC365" /LENGTH=294 /DNA_ID=CAMNT_0043079447 /DNA_START=133 /DNA_END=1017 /DNA_ORIENTATION=+
MAEESIYDLIPKVSPPKPKPPRYVSKFPSDVPPSYSTFGRAKHSASGAHNVAGEFSPKEPSHSHKKGGATFGTSSPHKPDFSKYKTKKIKDLPAPKKFTYGERRKPKLDTKLEKKHVPKREKKNFVTQNAVNNILEVHGMEAWGKKPDTKTRFVNKADYGKVPEYLKGIKADIKAEKEFIDHMLEKNKAAETESRGRMMDEQERQELLIALKVKWQEVNEKYSQVNHKFVHVAPSDGSKNTKGGGKKNRTRISHMSETGTVGETKRKEQYEKELDELDAAIKKLSRGAVLVVED